MQQFVFAIKNRVEREGGLENGAKKKTPMWENKKKETMMGHGCLEEGQEPSLGPHGVSGNQAMK